MDPMERIRVGYGRRPVAEMGKGDVEAYRPSIPWFAMWWARLLLPFAAGFAAGVWW